MRPNNVVEKLRSINEFYIWGCLPTVPGIDGVWNRIEDGWVVAFYREVYIVRYGTIFAKVRSAELVERL